MAHGTYSFTAFDLAGAPKRGELVGTSLNAVIEELKSRGLTVTDVTEKKSLLQFEIKLPTRVKAAELTVMTRQLATMVSSGMSLLRAFLVLEEQVDNPKLKEILYQVRTEIEEGLQLSEALSHHPKAFGPLYVAMVAAGEAGGVLEQALDRVADQLEKDDSLRRQVKSAMMYPSVVLSFAFIVLFALIAFIVPVFAATFEDFGGELPTITKITVAMSDIAKGYWWAIFGAMGGGFYAFKRWRTSSWGRPQWDALRVKVPFKIGDTVQKIALARWSRTFAALYSAGVPIMQAIEVTGRTSGNAIIERAMDSVIESVQSGGTIASPLREAPIFPEMVAQMVAVGEETGGLDTMLSKVADFYEDEVETAVKGLTSMLEPIMIVLVGGVVGFVVVAMYMPMFKIYDQIK